MTILAVDIGNTRTTYGAYDSQELVATFSHETLKDGGNVTSEFFKEISRIPRPEIVGISSVVPEVTKKTALLIDAMMRNVPIRILGNNDVPMTNKYQDPFSAGTDRLLASYAAYQQWGKSEKRPLIVIDFGTATTFDCISASGEYLGGAITLGVASSADALFRLAAQLPDIPLAIPAQAIGTTTVESMQSGIVLGALLGAEGLVQKMTEEAFAGAQPIIVATGGMSSLFKGKADFIDYFVPSLVLDGIRHILQP